MENATTFKFLHDATPAISVGVLTSNLLSLGSEISLLERTGVKLVHVDVMDGCFCPTMTVGPAIINAIKTTLLKDVHLMITEPLEKVAGYVAAGADIVTIHPEACSHVHRALQLLGTLTNANGEERGIVRGIALNPGTPLEVIEPLLGEIELILILAVNPGWGGQQFIPATAARVTRVQRMIATAGKDIIVGVDGGITKENVNIVVATGADVIVTGSAVFDGKTPEANARFMLAAAAKGSTKPRARERNLSV